MKPLTIDRIETPLAALWVLATGRGICSVRFDIGREKTLAEIPASPSRKALVPGGPLLRTAARQILEYLREERRAFSVRLDLIGFSVFELLVLKEVRAIPFGETRTYAQVAGHLRKPRETRRVRNILVRNPIPVADTAAAM